MADGIITPVDPVELSTTDQDIYTVPAGFWAVVKEILLNNLQESDVRVHLYRRTAASDDFDLRADHASNPLPATDTEVWELDLFLGVGEKIRGAASTTGVDVNMSVVLITTGTTADPTPVAPVLLTTTDQDVYSVPAGKMAIVKEILVVNKNTATAQQVHLYRRTGGSVDYNIRTDSANNVVQANDTERWGLNLMLDETEKLRGAISTTGVDLHVSLVLITKT